MTDAEIKAEYEFPSKPQWDEFAVRLQKALECDDLAALAAFAIAACRDAPRRFAVETSSAGASNRATHGRVSAQVSASCRSRR